MATCHGKGNQNASKYFQVTDSLSAISILKTSRKIETIFHTYPDLQKAISSMCHMLNMARTEDNRTAVKAIALPSN
jgi:hypothetical protein